METTDVVEARSEPTPAGEEAVDVEARAEPAPDAASAGSGDRAQPLVVALWLTDPCRERLVAALDPELSDDPRRAAEADVVVISTRGPRARAIPFVRKFTGSQSRVPVCVVCHTGGENVALEIMRAGAACVIAEGNETALGLLLAGDTGDTGDEGSLIISYEQRVGNERAEETSSSAADRVTGLPGPSAFADRLEELNQTGTPAAVAFAEIRNFGEATAGLDQKAVEVLRRRLSTLYRDVAERHGSELFSLSASRYALVGREAPADVVHEIGMQLVRIARAFAPAGTLPLRLGVGHAGPEVATDVVTLRELAERALEAAVAQDGEMVVNAEHLSTSLVSGTELDIAMRMVAYLGDNDGYPGSHSRRVADHATELARFLGYEGRELIRIRLAALLHDIGKVGLPPEAMRLADDVDPETLELYRSHPARGARYARTACGRQVSDAIMHHHERFDGQGFPDGLSAEDIPMAARIVAAADFYDALRTGVSEEGRGWSPAECLDAMRSVSGSVLDPVVVEAAELAFPR